MTLKLNPDLAKQADQRQAAIREAGRYIGTITRAEKLTSIKGTKGLGLSIRSDDGQSADYLDLWHTNSSGETLSGARTANAIMACLKLRDASEGEVQIEVWNKSAGKRENTTTIGYPTIQGKRIGLLIQVQLETDDKGKDRERLQVFGVFQPDTELTASEVLGGVTKPEKLAKLHEALMARPIIDKRSHEKRKEATDSGSVRTLDDMDEIPF